jgi:uncharacterized RDD family membrane protein YckC
MSGAVTVTTVVYSGDSFAGVRTRRFFAWAIDACVVALLTGLVWLVLTIGTLGLSLFVLPPLFPSIAVLYHAATVSGSGRGTWGMQAFDLKVLDYSTGESAPFLQAGAQAILFYLSWAMPLLFIVTLLESEKRYLHDLLSGLVVLRRSR